MEQKEIFKKARQHQELNSGFIAKSSEKNLYNHQEEALEWMKLRESKGYGGILAHEMGLGKTVTVLALVGSQNQFVPKNTLVVCPVSLVEQWRNEANRMGVASLVFKETG